MKKHSLYFSILAIFGAYGFSQNAFAVDTLIEASDINAMNGVDLTSVTDIARSPIYPILQTVNPGDKLTVFAPGYTFNVANYPCSACNSMNNNKIYPIYIKPNSSVYLQGEEGNHFVIDNMTSSNAAGIYLESNLPYTGEISDTYLNLTYVDIKQSGTFEAIFDYAKKSVWIKAQDSVFKPNIEVNHSNLYSNNKPVIGISDLDILLTGTMTYTPNQLPTSTTTLVVDKDTWGVLLTNRDARLKADGIVIQSGNSAIRMAETGPAGKNGYYGTVEVANSFLHITSPHNSSHPLSAVISMATGNLDAGNNLNQITKIKLNNVTLLAEGTTNGGISSMFSDSILEKTTILTHGDFGTGILTQNAGILTVGNLSSITTQGMNAPAIRMQISPGASETAGSRRGLLQTSVTDSNLSTNGESSNAIEIIPQYVTNNIYAEYIQAGGSINTMGINSALVYSAQGSKVSLTDLTGTSQKGPGIFLGVANTSAIISNTSSFTNTLNLQNTLITSVNGVGLKIGGGPHSKIQLSSSIIQSTASNRIAFLSANGRQNNTDIASKDITLSLSNSSELIGNIVLQDASQLTEMDMDTSMLFGNITLSGISSFGTLLLNNQSTWVGTTTISDSATPIAAVDIDANSTWTISNGLSAIVQNLTNTGNINFDPTLVQQTLNVTNDYTGSGVINMYGEYRSNDSDSHVDRLVIAGNASGQTKIRFISQDNIGAQTTTDGITIVTVQGTSSADSFTQQGDLVAGLYSYTLSERGSDTAGRVWYLTSAYQPPQPPQPPIDPPTPVDPPDPIKPPPEPPVPPEPIKPPVQPDNYRPEVIVTSIIPSLAHSAGALQLATYQERLAGTDNNLENKGGWFRYFNQQADIRYDTGSSDLEKAKSFENHGAQYDRTVNGFQFGYDIYRDNQLKLDYFSTEAMKRSGLFFGVGKSESDVQGIYNTRTVGHVAMSNIAIGAYYTAQLDNGWYSDTIGGINFLYDIKSTYSDSTTPATKTHGLSAMISSELGYKHFLNANTFIEPQAQISYQHINLNDMNIASDLALRFGNADALTTRLGVRLGQRLDQDPQSIAYIRLNVLNAHGSHADLHYSNPLLGASTERQINNDMAGSWIQIDAGLNRRIAKQSYGYVAVDYAKGIDQSDGKQLNLKFGIATQF